jgi:hypothetical protein
MLYLKNQQMAIGLSGIVVVCTNGKTQLKIQMDEFLKIKMTEFSVGSMLVILQFRSEKGLCLPIVINLDCSAFL